MSGVGAPAIRPRPVERARSGFGEGPKRPIRLEATSAPYMSGVGAPAIRPRPVARARKRPLYGPEPWPRAAKPARSPTARWANSIIIG
eukprot:gene13301-biopygen3499